LRYFAVMGTPDSGYALDYYPEEAKRYRRELGRRNIGDYATREEADRAVYDAIVQRNRQHTSVRP
jgi:hypothetical protein